MEPREIAAAEIRRLNHENGALEVEVRNLREALALWERCSNHYSKECPVAVQKALDATSKALYG